MAPALYLLLALYVFAKAIISCSAVIAAAETVTVVAPCSSGADDTALVQTMSSNGQCLAPGLYNIDPPALGPSGRRRDAMLNGSVCGAGAALTTVRLRGSAQHLYYLGVNVTNHGSVHDLTLDTSCLVDTIEQTHVVHTGVGVDAVSIHDVMFIHPKPTDGSKSGDCINVVGSATTPNAGMTIDHNVFQACARVGVQISRGLNDAVISNNVFSGASEDIGTEGGGAIANLTISHNTFTTTLTAGYALALERINGLTFDHNNVLGRPMLLFIVDNAQIGYSTMENGVKFSPVIRIGDTAHHISLTSMVLTQIASVGAPVLTMAPLDVNRQADLADLKISTSELNQQGAASFVVLQGVTGASLASSTLTYTGPSVFTPLSLQATASAGVAPAVSVPSSGVTETGTTHVGF